MRVWRSVPNGASADSYSKLEVWGTVRFLWAKRLNLTKINHEIVDVYGKHVIPRLTFWKWCNQFENSSTDSLMINVQCNSELLSVLFAVAEQVIRGNRYIKINAISSMLEILYGSVHSIVHEHLQYRKLCTRCVPRVLTATQKKTLMALFKCSAAICCRRQKIPVSNNHRGWIVVSPLYPRSKHSTMEYGYIRLPRGRNPKSNLI